VVVALVLAAATVSVPRAADHVIALSYSADLVALGFPSPLLRATVNGESVWFVVDTGASVHAVAKWLTTAAHVGTHDSKTTLRGSTGATTQAREAGPINLTLRDGSVLSLQEAAVVDFPPVFAEQRIGGLISPQQLTTDGQAVVLNLRTPSLTFAPFDGAVGALGIPATTALAGTHACSNEGAMPGRSYGAGVTIAGIPADMTVDTGATSTFVASSRVSRALAARATQNGQVQGVGGEVQSARTVAGVTIVRAGSARKADLILGGTSEGCGVDGLLGMDLLRGCTLALSDKTMAWSCGGSW
jgi:predicted aspartyl protease